MEVDVPKKLNGRFWSYAMSCVSDEVDEIRRVAGQLSALKPLLRQADEGLPTLQPPCFIDAKSYAAALARALGRGDVVVSLVAPEEAELKLAMEVGHASTLAREFLVGRRHLLDAAEAQFPGFMRKYVEILGTPLAVFLVSSCGLAFVACSNETYAEAVAGYANAPAYYLAAVLLGDDAAIAELAPLMRKLAQGIPVLESRDAPGTWLVLCG